MLGYLAAKPPCPSTWKPERGEPLITTGKRAGHKHTGVKKILQLLEWVRRVKPEVGKGLPLTKHSTPATARQGRGQA